MARPAPQLRKQTLGRARPEACLPMKSCCANTAAPLRCEALTGTSVEPATVRAERRSPRCAGTSCTKQCRSLKGFPAEFSRKERVHGVENRVRVRTRFFANGCPTAKCKRDDSQLRQSSGLL